MADPLLARVPVGEIPIVMIGRPDIEGISYVDVDNFDGGRQAATHLCNLGYRRIGILGAPVNTTAGVDRLNGFIEGLALCGLALNPALRVDGDFSETSGYAAMQQLIPHEPEAVFVASDTMAVGAVRALREAGVAVPQEVALMSFDGLPASEKSTPTLTTIRQPVSRTGARAVHLLNDLVTGIASAPVVEIMPVELVVRESCGAMPASAAPRA